MPVYGDMICFFTEGFQDFLYFNMSPLPTGGFTDRTEEVHIKGMLQHVNSGLLKQEGDTITGVVHPAFWTKSKLESGHFITDGTTIYRITKSKDWNHHGGFYKYDIETVVGNKDTDLGIEDMVNNAKNTY